ncbi:phosphoketolase family protein [Chitinophaga ginsengisoli]|uniref:Xylulose-5-phosphate/fructose-6-phosphate phosphoketolase n=1 Tax=Chitinophaga ginsengisoli TaxID=363837 RepID=A0A2P8GDG1_9BACT|nr:phosphoketolase family protein [Chitinophaga ginsengisoli]PSL31990.1 xylulose-5-phosphate/fructose-6-phosphate phosphoketolase [Chitinophaga ginsengisoli]
MAILTPEQIHDMHAYWEASNYLAAAQIYLQANPLLKEPLLPEHIKPRLLGHWGTSPGLNFIYVHLNRLIRDTNASILFVCGPGHGAPAVMANVYMEGTYTETYPDITQDEKGLKQFFRQFSSPGGIPSHVSPHTPGSIHEGGELGYSLAHAAGAVMDNPDLITACVVGDGEAETGPLAGSWKLNSFLNPVRDGAVLPILHLNGYKISGPTVMGRMSDTRLATLFAGYGYMPLFVKAKETEEVHQEMAAALDTAYQQIREIQDNARSSKKHTESLHWPMIILRSPKGWTGPVMWKGKRIEGTFRSHQVPLMDVKEDQDQLALLEQWLRSYKPETHFTPEGRLLPSLAQLAPTGDKRMGANPYANGGKTVQPLDMPDFSLYAVEVTKPGVTIAECTRELGKMLRDVFKLNAESSNFRLFCPDETTSNRLNAVFEATDRCFMEPLLDDDDHLSPDGRVLEVLSEHLCQGWLEGYLLTGRHGIFPCYEAFVTIVDSMFNQHAKWLKMCLEIPWRNDLPSLNYLITSHSWRQDHNGYSHQGPGFIDTVVNKKSSVIRIYLPPDANCLLSVMDHCLKSKNYVNLVVAGKQPALQWLNIAQATAHCAQGASVWDWASNDNHEKPDVVLACAGDVPTLETIAAAWLLRKHIPDLKVRVVNVVDLMSLSPKDYHSHGLETALFTELFTDDAPVIFAFHGYVRIVHDLVHGRPDPARFHVRGFIEEGTTTTPFDMVVLNKISRFHLAIAAIERTEKTLEKGDAVISLFENKLRMHSIYIRECLEDMPDIKNWKWEDLK